MAWKASMLAMLGLVAALLSYPTALSMAEASLISMPTEDVHRGHAPVVFLAESLTPDYYADSCPDVRGLVRSAVGEALQKDIALAAGLIRLFYHDCFPQGCDASILLAGAESELQMWPNRFLQRAAVQLIDDIRIKVHHACGPVVSCADIMALATHDAVLKSGGQSYLVPLGRLDSLEPAPLSTVSELPLPTFNISQLIEAFESRSLDVTDLVALSGAHTIGGAHCTSYADRFAGEANSNEFVRMLLHNCTTGDIRDKQDLDVTTPNKFDDKYFGNLEAGKGVLNSDMQLLHDPRAMELVKGIAENQWWFWNEFDTSIKKLGQLQGPQGNAGEVRTISCSVPNYKSSNVGEV
ncbi:peroxidase 12-like [Triticum dicoccoides]|uniref:peroxidase 12-like n=1 Tax=Triticum dicoccoides TaxID=85692 RepID=UPI00188E1F8D|nr:peroxidase 12-like [Triticum dicoccoides]